MAYLPAATVPEDRDARPPRWWHWLLAILLPLVFVIPLAIWLLRRAVAIIWNRGA
jgi:hypothetical protein